MSDITLVTGYLLSCSWLAVFFFGVLVGVLYATRFKSKD